MATISFRDFSQGQPVKTIGDEGKVQTQEQNGGQKLFSQLAERAKTFGKEAVTLGTLGASTMTPQDFNATGQDRSLAALQGLNRAGQSPIRMAGAVGGAIGDVVGAGLEATGLDKPIGQVLAPIAESQPVQKAMEVFKSLPQETQEVLGAIVNTANIPISGAGLGVAKTGIQKAGQVATETVAPLAKKVLPKLTPDAEQIMQRVARVSKGKQANFEARAGESIGAYLDKRGIYGDVDQITEQLYNRFQQSKGTADEALASLQGNYQPTAVRTALAELEKKLTRVSSEGATDPNLGKVSGLLAKFDNQGLTMSEINEAKRLYERNVKLDFLRENNPEGITTANNIDNAIRSWQFNQAEKLGLKNLPEINKETMLAKQLLDDLGKEYAGSAGNNMITLTDWIVLSGGDPTAVAGFLTKQGLSSKKVQSFIAKLISKNQPKKGQVTPQTGEATVLPIGTYKDFLKETSRNAKPTTQPQVKKGLSPQTNSTTKEGVVNELINNPMRGSVTPSEFLPKKKVGSEIKVEANTTPTPETKKIIDSYKEGKVMYRGEGGGGGIKLTNPETGNALGEGDYYANLSQASRYGKTIKEKTVKLDNPLLIQTDQDLRNITGGLNLNETNPLLKKKQIEEARQRILDAGYDGVIVKMKNYQESRYLDKLFGHDQVIDYTRFKTSLSPLEQEAKKYKSAEEFANSYLYHGTKSPFDTFDFSKQGTGSSGNAHGSGAYFTTSHYIATDYSKGYGNVMDIISGKEGKVKGSVLMTKKPEGELLDFRKFISSVQPKNFYIEGLKKMEKDGFSGVLKDENVINQLKRSDFSKDNIANIIDRLDIEISNNSQYAGKLNDQYGILDYFLPKDKYVGLFDNSAGYGAPKETNLDTAKDIILFNKGKEIKTVPALTKSQLTDIWKKANKK